MASINIQLSTEIMQVTKPLLRKSQVESLRFLSSMTLELTGLAQANRLLMVSYFLEMAYIEINDTLREDHAKRDNVTAKPNEHFELAA